MVLRPSSFGPQYYVFAVFCSRGDFGRLGHGNSSDLFIPHPIKALSGLQIKQIACGDSHCLAITADGDVHRYWLRYIFLRMPWCLHLRKRYDDTLELKLGSVVCEDCHPLVLPRHQKSGGGAVVF